MKGNSFVVKVSQTQFYETLRLLETTITATVDSRLSSQTVVTILEKIKGLLTFDGVPLSVFGKNGSHTGGVRYTVKMLARVGSVSSNTNNPFGFKTGDVITLTNESSFTDVANTPSLKSIIATTVNNRLGNRSYNLDVYNIVISFSVKE